jgi:SNF2 family DNA or RNA helicase
MAVDNVAPSSEPVKIIDNITNKLCDDLALSIKQNSKVSIAAACFSIYAYKILKEELENVESLRFIFTSPTFITEKAPKEKREFYIPRLSRERSLYGTEFEVKLRNELTQKAIAKECADWIRNKVKFKSNITDEHMSGYINVQNGANSMTYIPVNGFTTVDLGCEHGDMAYNLVTRMSSPSTATFFNTFDQLWNDKNKLQDVTKEVINNITTAYKENPPEFIYFITLYNIFNEFLEDISEDVLPNEATGFKNSKIWNKLYDFQKDAALAIINKLEKYNGCILADSVGLGKTFTALAVIKYYENRNKSVLVLCPKKLSDNWNTYKGNYVNNPVMEDRFRYDVLYHTDLSRAGGLSNGLDLSRLNWGNYDLLVIDESHNFRNGGDITEENVDEKENRYQKLMRQVIRAGVKTKVLMLSATPVNNRFNDLKNQLALAYEGHSAQINEKLDTKKTVEQIFTSAQREFNIWSKLPPTERSTESLLSQLDFDFFELLDSVTIARSRKHIRKYYDIKAVGEFPTRLKPISKRPKLTDVSDAINFNDIYAQLSMLNLSVYTPSNFIQESCVYKYEDQAEKENVNLTLAGREQGIMRLMRINLLKRLESSVHSFKLTLKRVRTLIETTIDDIDEYKRTKTAKTLSMTDISNADEFDFEEQNMEVFSVGKKIKVDICDMDYLSWESDLMRDRDILTKLIDLLDVITPEHDTKLQLLLTTLAEKIHHPINDENKKVLVFTAFADTAEYLYEHVSKYIKKNFGLDVAMITGSVDGCSTIPKLQANFNNVLTCFSPISKEKAILMPDSKAEITVLIATDCISEGQNLQDCDYLINYDIHWNPVRIIQRFGRIDRIGSKNKFIQLVNFWPDMTLDEYINLKARVETRMKISVMSASGDENPLSELSDEEQGDLEYRKQQLKRLQEEVIDLEDMSSGVSITDLGLNEFRLDLLDYIKTNPDVDKAPSGMNAVVPASDDNPAGVIFVLKNRNGGVNIGNQNRLHPFYLVYIAEDGTVICNHLAPKEILDKMRLLCKGYAEPHVSLCNVFNKETKDGKDMHKTSKLLSDAIHSIINVKEERAVDSFFKQGAIAFMDETIKGLDDFELICFLVVK